MIKPLQFLGRHSNRETDLPIIKMDLPDQALDLDVDGAIVVIQLIAFLPVTVVGVVVVVGVVGVEVFYD